MLKELFTDYKEMVLGGQIGWIKKHWIAYLVILAISAFVGSIPFIAMKIKGKIEYARIERRMKEIAGTNKD